MENPANLIVNHRTLSTKTMTYPRSICISARSSDPSLTFINTTYTAKQHAEVRASISPKIGCGGRSELSVLEIAESDWVTRMTPKKLCISAA